ncbi:hypothetical protein M409DRAFT_18573 [Zasmidium cellare ATCC 36951]|uniref:Uncharacterized protein n=1 Tax=Zasmidium cellare ATCC 36951 TaxID=1080233 RepID=A0A6A6D1D6_ZASCE|nr:uncharacterized protein M409DRAFT_18573 [Zasmidium cellare ATCC 36951]KAF2171456.1 hypothetical protein M409DRAFT_18573 [Zasmidium cellare ATCC 36951]
MGSIKGLSEDPKDKKQQRRTDPQNNFNSEQTSRTENAFDHSQMASKLTLLATATLALLTGAQASGSVVQGYRGTLCNGELEWQVVGASGQCINLGMRTEEAVSILAAASSGHRIGLYSDDDCASPSNVFEIPPDETGCYNGETAVRSVYFSSV